MAKKTITLEVTAEQLDDLIYSIDRTCTRHLLDMTESEGTTREGHKLMLEVLDQLRSGLEAAQRKGGD